MIVAITRPVSSSIGDCQLTHLQRRSIDLDRARAQHTRYQACLEALGCRVVTLAEEPDLPDAVFVEDTAVVLDELAVVTRPGAPSRRPETTAVADTLRDFRPLAAIAAPGTLDGGDVLPIGHTLYVGLSGRSNRAGIEQLRRHVERCGWRVEGVPVDGCLHLKSAVSRVAADTILVNSSWVDPRLFPGVETIEIDPGEPFAANALLAGDTIVYPDAFPSTRSRLEARGLRVVTVDVSELAKAEGGVTCCSLLVGA